MSKSLSRTAFIAALGLSILAAPAAMAEGDGPMREPRPELTREMALQIAGERFDRADTNEDGVLSHEEMRGAAKGMRKHFKDRRDHGDDRGMQAKPFREGADERPMHKKRPPAGRAAFQGQGGAPEAGPDLEQMESMEPPMPMMQPASAENQSAREFRRDHPRRDRDGANRPGKGGPRSIDDFFDRFDHDGDGVITREEMMSARQAEK